MRQHWQHGPRILDNGMVRFRLWAPSAETVHLSLENGATLPMNAADDGWYMLDCAEAGVGSLYRFLINGELPVPDPASRFQPYDVEGPSEVVAPDFPWQDTEWKGRPWAETVLYELHVGCFTPEGTHQGVENKLDYLTALGITAIELMPLADFAGKRNWGYDGVLPYAPDSRYGRPEDLKRLVQSAHQRRIMVFLDVVYNHFGPSGNYLHQYADHFFTERHRTPWGAAINFDDTDSEYVRSFFIENALYWLTEFHIDGLRFDAVHAIRDDSSYPFLHELAETIRQKLPADRHIHLVLENEHNNAALLLQEKGEFPLFNAQWNDDFHHNCHVLMTGQTSGYYSAYADAPLDRLARCLHEGFDYQGHPLPNGRNRGQRCSHLSPLAFVNCLQNHDQIGNRALGERLITLTGRKKLRFFTPMLLLSPYIPLLFMGEEWGATQPFLFFCEYTGELADAVREGRRREFAAFPEFSDPQRREMIPDPNALSTFQASALDWNAQDADWFAIIRNLLELRHRYVVPLLTSDWRENTQEWLAEGVLQTIWRFEAGDLQLLANFSARSQPCPSVSGMAIYGKPGDVLPPQSTLWLVENRL